MNMISKEFNKIFLRRNSKRLVTITEDDITLTYSDSNIEMTTSMIGSFRRTIAKDILNVRRHDILIYVKDSYTGTLLENPNRYSLNPEHYDVVDANSGEVLNITLDQVVNHITQNFSKKLDIIDKRITNDLTPTVLKSDDSQTASDSILSPLCSLSVDESSQEDYYIHSLKLVLPKLTNSDFLEVLSTVVVSPNWCSDNKFSGIFKDELNRRKGTNQQLN